MRDIPAAISEAFYAGVRFAREHPGTSEQADAELKRWFAMPYVQRHIADMLGKGGGNVSNSGLAGRYFGGVSGGLYMGSVGGGEPVRDHHWRCLRQDCPVRPPVLCPSAPKCYTCGQDMTRVIPSLAAYVGITIDTGYVVEGD